MGFGEKIKRAFKRIKGKLIVSFILWLILVIVFVAPMAVSLFNANQPGVDFWTVLFESIGVNIVKPLSAFGQCITGGTNGQFGSVLLPFSIVYILAVTLGIAKAFPKHEFDGIENGSSDWCVNGEQYKVLSNKEGIILAEKNYLPVDKRGNVNVLVVGRIWCW